MMECDASFAVQISLFSSSRALREHETGRV
jgi:hypothetical protein